MRGLKSEDLVAMIDFLYFGEANVYQESLDSFLAVAEELQLKGLTGSGAEKEAEELLNKPTIKKKGNFTKQETPDPLCSLDKEESSPPLERTVAVTDYTVAVTDYTVAADLQDL